MTCMGLSAYRYFHDDILFYLGCRSELTTFVMVCVHEWWALNPGSCEWWASIPPGLITLGLFLNVTNMHTNMNSYVPLCALRYVPSRHTYQRMSVFYTLTTCPFQQWHCDSTSIFFKTFDRMEHLLSKCKLLSGG